MPKHLASTLTIGCPSLHLLEGVAFASARFVSPGRHLAKVAAHSSLCDQVVDVVIGNLMSPLRKQPLEIQKAVDVPDLSFPSAGVDDSEYDQQDE